MKTKTNESEQLVKVPKAGLLSLVLSKLEGRMLFPKKVEEAKKYLRRANIS